VNPITQEASSKTPPFTVALTGGIASGKSTVARLFSSWGAKVVDADSVAREVVAPGSPGLAEVISTFGPSIQSDDGTLNRKKLGEIVFKDSKSREKLEQILHPRIRTRWLTLRNETLALSPPLRPPLLVYEVPLYFETGASYPEIDRVITVTAPESWRREQIMSRDNLNEQEAHQRISSQLPDTVKAEKSDYVIENNGTLDELAVKAKKVFDSLTMK
jgi:dephospho-CoA kinase